MIVAVVFFAVISLTVILGTAPQVVRQINTVDNFRDSRESFAITQALNEDIVYRIKNNINVPSTVTINIGTASSTATIVNTGSLTKQVISTGNDNNLFRKTKTDLVIGSGASFHYGVQSGEGGFDLSNNTIVYGNVYSDGPVTGTGLVKGDVVSAGPNGLIDGIDIEGNALAHTIKNSHIDGDAYYATTILNSTVGGTKYPGSPDQATSTMPIPDDQIAAMESVAEAGGVIGCATSYTVSGGNLGPVKIPCNVTLDGNITLTGPVWVRGNITTSNNANIRVSSTLGNQSIAIIADDPFNKNGSGIITISNNAVFYGSGDPASYVILISGNTASENSLTTKAINVNNNTVGDLLVYAPHGDINMSNNTSVKELTSYSMSMSNNATVQYQTGIANLLFNYGPGGGFNITNWREIPN